MEAITKSLGELVGAAKDLDGTQKADLAKALRKAADELDPPAAATDTDKSKDGAAATAAATDAGATGAAAGGKTDTSKADASWPMDMNRG